ncbi:unnamed protein product, partial [Polarella glacialis]
GGQDAAEKEVEGGCKKCCFALLDCMALIITSIAAVCSACWRMTKVYVAYPCKQSCVETWDGLQETLFPYKKGVSKVPYSYTDVPSFKFP